MGSTQIGVRIDSGDYNRLKKIAADTNQTLADVAREAIARYLHPNGRGTKLQSRLTRIESQLARLGHVVVETL